MHWSKSEKSEKDLAKVLQERSEISARLEQAEKRSIDLDKKVFDLSRSDKLGKLQLSKLEAKNKELVKQYNQKVRDVAQLKSEMKNMNVAAGGNNNRRNNRNGISTLSGPRDQSGSLPRNEVRDPERILDQVVAANRQRYANEDTQLANSNGRRSSGAIAISAPIQIADNRENSGNNQASAANRTIAQVGATANTNAVGKIATVKPGEGVAQVVYRELGTRDPQIIDWVIRENNIKLNGRGNPLVHPQQKLKLPADLPSERADVGARRR